MLGTIEHNQDRVSERLAEPEVANALSIPIGAAALRIERVYYKDTGVPVQFTRCWYPSDRYKYKVSFYYRGDLDVDYQ